MRFSHCVLALLLLALPLSAAAFESRLLDSAGRPIAAAQISVAGEGSTARTGADGRFALEPEPKLPATLIVVGSRGELFPPYQLLALSPEIRLDPAYRESITVTTGATPNIEGTPASAPVVLGAEELEQRKPARVADAVASTAGVSLRGEGPPAVPVVRGLAGGRTLLLIDDARIVAERRAGPSATFVDPLSLGSIEISRGPGSVTYGSDAIGGIIHLRPRDPVAGESDFRYNLWTSFGGTSERAASVESSSDALGGAILVSVHARAAGDSTDGNGATIENSQFRDRGGLLRLVRDRSWGRMRAGLMTSIAREVGAPSIEPAATVYPDERATLLTLAADVLRTGKWKAESFRASLGSYSITTNRVRTSGIESAIVKARDASLRWSAERTGAQSRLTAGIDFVTRFDLRAPGSIDDAERYDTGVHATLATDVLPRLHLASGARLDAIATHNRGGWFGDHSRDDIAPSGFAAITANLRGGLSATLQAASGYREPSLSDRYFRGISGRGFITGNPELEPERSIQFDGSVTWRGARSRAALYGYHYRIQDLVERYRSGNDFFFHNRGAADIGGIEVEAATRIAANFELQLGAAVARGEDADTGAALDDIAPPTLHASLRWASERASAFVASSSYGRDDRPGPVEVGRPGYAEAELGFGWRIAPRLELRIAVRNATDADHFGSADAAAARAPGRSWMIGVNR